MKITLRTSLNIKQKIIMDHDLKEMCIIVKWSGKEYPIVDITEHDSVAILRHEIFKKTHVKPERQKLLNLKYKGFSFSNYNFRKV